MRPLVNPYVNLNDLINQIRRADGNATLCSLKKQNCLDIISQMQNVNSLSLNRDENRFNILKTDAFIVIKRTKIFQNLNRTEEPVHSILVIDLPLPERESYKGMYGVIPCEDTQFGDPDTDQSTAIERIANTLLQDTLEVLKEYSVTNEAPLRLST